LAKARTLPRNSRNTKLILTCEHGGNKIPHAYLPYFRNAKKVLSTHRGWDIGALKVAKFLARDLKAPLLYAEVSRLLVDLNRTPTHPTAFSEFLDSLTAVEKNKVLKKYHSPYRDLVQQKVLSRVSKKQEVFHFSIHSFTPILNKIVRLCDIGVLYDPKRSLEKAVARNLQLQLKRSFPNFRIRMNYPYKGTGDGLTSTLRKRTLAKKYSGIEIELNQKLLIEQTPRDRQRFAQTLAQCLESAIEKI
jgi:predicted N-formylglutamate amidohydrolase